jgi:N-acetylneuraminic acid mutarotase
MKVLPVGGAHFVWGSLCALLVLNAPGIAGSWQTKASLPTPQSAAAVAAINGLLYVAGGYNNNANSNLLAFDPSTNQWSSLASMPGPRYQSAAAVINGKLYVAGGFNGSGTLQNLVEAYDPYVNTWTTLAPMPHGVANPASAVIDGKLYVFGGYNGTNDVTTVQVYDPIKNTWSKTKPTVPIAPDSFGCDVLYGIAFVVGGSISGTFLSTNYLYFESPSIP